MKTSQVTVVISSILSGALMSSCARKVETLKAPPMVSSAVVVKSEPAPHPEVPKESVLSVENASQGHFTTTTATGASAAEEAVLEARMDEKIQVEVSLNKSAILGKTFLYGADLQYSALNDSDYELILQSLAIGHLPAQFRLVGSELQLLGDQRHSFESDVNHPEILIQSFPVVAESGDSITVRITQASPLLMSMLGVPGTVGRSWVRSVKFVPQGNYLMLETSVLGSDGSLMEFMESVFPRENLVPAPKSVDPLLMDASLEPWAERFRFLGAGLVYRDLPGVGRIPVEAASRFAVPGTGATIDWYVTPNVPDEYLGDIRTGIEGWNRYSQAMWGRDMLRFVGKLPAGIKIGDPRYNVVNWDNVAMAGAAYESQATDPESGLQSHSLIYLPLAWVNIGKEYWSRGELSDAQKGVTEYLQRTLKTHHYLGQSLKTNCLADPSMKIALEAQQRPEAFAHELLKGVLFHEMGHALGLAHNFKGSLSWDAHDEGSAFSTSIMDYNQYHLERGAFESVESAKGPLLEYDRQILSVLYNKGLDVHQEDAVVPVCNDDETDSLLDGVDPLCIRYDSGKDPTQALQETIRLITDAGDVWGPTRSLPAALLDTVKQLGVASDIGSLEDAQKKVQTQVSQSLGLVNYYIYTGANSLNYMTRANLRSLLTFKNHILPETYIESEMRARALAGLQYVAHLSTLPDAVVEALHTAAVQTVEWFLKTPAVEGLSPEKQKELTATLQKGYRQLEDTLYRSPTSLLALTRERVLGSLQRVPSAPFHMIRTANGLVDFEREVIDLLETELTSPYLVTEEGVTTGKTRSLRERSAYARALLSFRDTRLGEQALLRVESKIDQEFTGAANARERENLRSLIRILKTR